MFFESVLGNIARGLNTDRAYEVGAMTKDSIDSTNKKKVNFIFITKELKIRKNDVTLQWLHFVMASLCNSFTLPGYGITLKWLCTF